MSKYSESIAVVQAIQEQLQLPMLETLQYIQAHTNKFNLSELAAFYTVMEGFSALFAPVEA